MKSTTIENAPKFKLMKGVKMTLIGNGERMSFIRIKIKPGAVIPDHSHPHEQIGTCVEGEGVLTSGGEALKVVPGITWTIPPEEVHRFEAKGENPTLIHEIWSPPREDYKKLAKVV